MVAAHPGEDGQIGAAVLDRAEGRRHDRPGRIVDRPDEGQARGAALEPVVRAAVDLDEETGLGHPLAPAPVLRRPPGSGRPDPGPAEQALERRSADDDGLVLGQELGQVAVVHPAIAGRREVHDPFPGGRRQASWRSPPAVAVDDAVDAHRPEATEQPPGRALAGTEQGRGFGNRQRSVTPAGQDIDPLLVSRIQGQSLPHRWRLTKSLSS